MDHSVTRAILVPAVIQSIMKHCGWEENLALDAFYRSATAAALCDDETGLYGQSALHIFGLFLAELEGR